MSDREGTGATLTFGTSTFSGVVLGIGAINFSRAAIEAHSLTSDHANVEPSDVEEWSVDIEVEAGFSAMLPFGADPETITITEKLLSGQSTAGKIEGTGWIERLGQSFPWRNRKGGTATIRFSAKPTVTAGS